MIFHSASCEAALVFLSSQSSLAHDIRGPVWPSLHLYIQVWVSPQCDSWLSQISMLSAPRNLWSWCFYCFCQKAPSSLTPSIREAFPPQVASWLSRCVVMVSPGLHERRDSVIHSTGLGNSGHPAVIRAGGSHAFLYLLLRLSQDVGTVLYFRSFFLLAACKILAPWPGLKPMSPAVEAWNLNHWTVREVPILNIL